MTGTDWLRILLAACAAASILWGVACYRLGVRRDQLDEAARRHPAGKAQLRVVR